VRELLTRDNSERYGGDLYSARRGAESGDGHCHRHLIESQSDGLGALTAGAALSQGAKAGTFSMASPSVTGVSYAFAATGMTQNGTADFGGGLQLNPDGSVPGVMAINDLVNSFVSRSVAVPYTVDPTDRVTLSNLTSPSFSGALALQFYLDGNGNALELGIDTSEASAAAAYAQGGGSDFEGQFAFAAQGFWSANAGVYPAWSAAGLTTISGGAVAGFSDYTLQNPADSFTVMPGAGLSGDAEQQRGRADALRPERRGPAGSRRLR
jgi:hypothetical protein